MIELLTGGLYLGLFLWVFWALYVLVMGIYRAHLSGRMSRVMYALALPWVAVGFAVDVLANLLVATVFFAEAPREWLVTSRLQRHMRTRHGWRYRQARFVCDHLLDVFDPSGEHC